MCIFLIVEIAFIPHSSVVVFPKYGMRMLGGVTNQILLDNDNDNDNDNENNFIAM